MKNILISGVTGLLGSNLVQGLGIDLNIVGIARSRLKEYDYECLNLERVKLHYGDIADYSFVSDVINKYEIDTVFHLAANAIVRTSQRSPLHCFESNIRGTWNVLEACRQNGTVRAIVAMASDKYYGQTKTLPYVEEMAPVPGSPYEVSKTCSDFICSSYYKTYGLPVATVRGANVFGRGDLNLSRIVPNSCKLLLEDKPPIIWKDVSKFRREFIYVEDMASAIAHLAINIHKTAGEAYNVGSGRSYLIEDFVNLLCKVSGKDIKPEFPEKDIPFLEIPEQYLSVDKIKEHIGWEATQTIEDFEGCLEKTYNWYKEYYNV